MIGTGIRDVTALGYGLTNLRDLRECTLDFAGAPVNNNMYL